MQSNRTTCAFKGCRRVPRSHGLCDGHRQQRAAGKELTPLRQNDGVPVTARDDLGRKRCGRCKVWKPESDFARNKATRDGLLNRCRTCCQAAVRGARYGLSDKEHADLLAQQGGGCAICGGQSTDGKSLHVDHDHGCCPGERSCGACVRGLLCSDCNRALGVMKDDAARLRAAADYLERTS